MPTTKSDFSLVRQTLIWLLLTLIFYSILRLEFLLWNWKTWYQSLPILEIIYGFIQGPRYDLASIAWLSLPTILLALFPCPDSFYGVKVRLLKAIFLLIHIPFLFLNMIDPEFVHFSGRRMTTDSFYLVRESHSKWAALWSTYWPLISINFCLLIIFVWLLSGRRNQGHSFSKATVRTPPTPVPAPSETASMAAPILVTESGWRSKSRRLLVSLSIILGFIVVARGGLQPKPLEMAHAAAISPDFRVTHLALNSSFTTIHSLQKKGLRHHHDFATPEALEPLLNASAPGELVQPWDRPPKNVVLFILESFGLEYTGLDHHNKKSFTPFLDSLKKDSLYFENSFANGRRSIESLPSLLASMPGLLDEPFLASQFQTNTLPPLGQAMSHQGIASAFFHGGANGTMFFEEFTRRLGIQRYYGKNEYPNPADDDGSWGIWDGPFLNFFGRELDTTLTAPFFVTFFSLSSHHPFKVPEEYRQKLPSGPLPILQAVAYTDAMLAEFFRTFAQSSWYKDTLFIFTADHTSKSYLPEYQTPLNSFRVPLLLYYPGGKLTAEHLKLDLKEPVQHIDVLPTLSDLFHLDLQTSKLSRSLLRTGRRQVSLYLDGQQLLVTKDQSLMRPSTSTGETETTTSTGTGLLTPKATTTTTSIATSTANTTSPPTTLLQPWLAHRQYFINSLLDNKL